MKYYIYDENNLMKDRMSILISDKLDLRTQNITGNKESQFITKESICEVDSNSVYIPNNTFQNIEAKINITEQRENFMIVVKNLNQFFHNKQK